MNILEHRCAPRVQAHYYLLHMKCFFQLVIHMTYIIFYKYVGDDDVMNKLMK